MARSTRSLLNVKLTHPYKTYKYYPTSNITTTNRDNFDRFFIRIKKLLTATQYTQYLLSIYEKNIEIFHQTSEKKTTFNIYSNEDSIEQHIRDFKSNMERFVITDNKTYINTKSPREYFRTTLVSN